MERIGVRELRQHASLSLDRVKAGETAEVTERGRLVTLLVPPTPAVTARELLIAADELRPAALPFRLPERVQPSRDTAVVLDELRQEE